MSAYTISAALTVLLLSPWLVPYLICQGGVLVGWYIARTTSGRRQTLLETSRSALKRKSPKAKEEEKTSSASSSDGDWEKVDENLQQHGSGIITGDKSWAGIVGFFHPFCNAGGGGERVLWAAIKATQLRWPNAVCVVYTGDHDANKAQIIRRVQDRFNISLEAATLHFLYLGTRHWVLASTWPRFTLLGQSLGSLILALDAFGLVVPDIFIDTMGYAFALGLCKLLFPKVPTGAYVHYPTISTDMLQSLDDTKAAEGGRGLNAGAGQGTRGKAKKAYWHLFAWLYSRVGASIDVVMTNSSWTQSHIQTLWGPFRRKRPAQEDITVVFPPVAVESLTSQIDVTPSSEKNRLRHLLYIAQFRPEKNHALIVSAFAQFLHSRKDWPSSARPKLVLVGSVRDSDDAKRVYKLRLLAHELQIKNDVEFVCDASWEQVLDRLAKSSVGVNGMWNEHFGIGVVEYQAAGLISVVNDSGGPKGDIVIEVDGGRTGFHASTTSEYANAFAEALGLDAEETLAMRLRARKSSQRFTEAAFAEKWIENVEKLVALQTKLRPRR